MVGDISLERRPDEQGIETPIVGPLTRDQCLGDRALERRPDEQGIETTAQGE